MPIAWVRIRRGGRRYVPQAEPAPGRVRWSLAFGSLTSVSAAGVIPFHWQGDPGRNQECTQCLRVGLQRGPASRGESHRGALPFAMAGLVRLDVAALFELAKVGDEVARCEVEQVLQSRKRQAVSFPKSTQSDNQFEPNRRMDQRVQFVFHEW